MDSDSDSFISAADLKYFLKGKLEIEQCKMILEECASIINGQSEGAQQMQEGYKMNFTHFKDIV